MRLIDLDAIHNFRCPHSVKELKDWLYSLPEIHDPEQLKAQWCDYVVGTCKCSHCGRHSAWTYRYCPGCGARMENGDL